jgi:hypothetical protein
MNNKKTLLYNIINLDFILLETSAHKISNFFLEKIKRKKNYIIRLVTSDVVKLFKKFLKLFNFIKKFKQLSYSFIYIWLGSDFLFEFFKFFFHKYKLQCILNYSLFFPKFEKYRSLQSSIVIDQFLTQKEFFYYFYNNLYLVSTLNYIESLDSFTYKIFMNFNDYKKLIFIGLLLNSVFKKHEKT